MAGGLVKCSKIRHIVSLKQMLRRWRNKARLSSVSRCVPSDVPSGHVAGPLVIPCEESVFEEAIRFISRSDSSRSSRFTCPDDLQKCHGGIKSMLIESRPLLHAAVVEKVVW
uniref:Uncharacterized protein n=1 Tax=Brassica campestris TaxID=3711 RepID=M4D6S8_BRACM